MVRHGPSLSSRIHRKGIHASAAGSGDGIPAHLLALLDATVEIPQLGVIRSLNVHVSGAIAVYSYSQQWGLRMRS